MQRIKIGTLLYRTRIERGISREQLCKGLCQVSTLSYYENGKRIPDNLLFFYFIQRLGAKPEDFALLLSKEEYKYYIWKEKTMSALEEEEWEKLKELLENCEEVQIKCNQNIQRQYHYYLKAVLAVKNVETRAMGVEYLRKAAEETITDIFNIHKNKSLLGSTEINIIINYLYYGALEKLITEEEIKHLFQELDTYILQGIMEKDEQAKVYPKLVCIWKKICDGYGFSYNSIELCEKAIQLLKDTYKIYDITELLDVYAHLLDECGLEKSAIIKKQNLVFKAILEESGVDITFRPEILYDRNVKLYMMHEYLYSCRMQKGMTQECLCEGICEPESYSRLENGKRMPNMKTYRALEEKFDAGWGYYRGELSTDNLHLYELRRMHRTANFKEHWGESQRILAEMEKLLDMKQVNNYQYIKSKQNFGDYRLGKISSEEWYDRSKELLHLTVSENERLCYYSQTELELIAHMSIALRAMKKYEEGIRLLESTLKRSVQSGVEIEYQWNGVCFAVRCLSNLYFSLGRYNESRQLAQYVLSTNLKIRNAFNLPNVLDAIADNLEHMGEQYSSQYKKLYRQTYYVGDFFELDNIRTFFDEYYRENFDSNIVWYEC